MKRTLKRDRLRLARISEGDYRKMLAEWAIKYGKRTDFNPANTVSTIECKKCGLSRDEVRIVRHHTGNDLKWARLFPEHFAQRYLLFHPQDVVAICDECHLWVHVLYADIYEQELLEEYLSLNEITPDFCEKWRKKYQRLCNDWLEGKYSDYESAYEWEQRKRAKRKGQRSRNQAR